MKQDDQSKLILVVEDNEKNMKLMAGLLELAGCRMLRAYDGISALEMLKVQIPDLVILDIGLPGKDGYTVYKEIREMPHLDFVKIMACTASVMREDLDKMLTLGFDAVITKPFNIKKLISELERLLNIKLNTQL